MNKELGELINQIKNEYGIAISLDEHADEDKVKKILSELAAANASEEKGAKEDFLLNLVLDGFSSEDKENLSKELEKYSLHPTDIVFPVLILFESQEDADEYIAEADGFSDAAIKCNDKSVLMLMNLSHKADAEELRETASGVQSTIETETMKSAHVIYDTYIIGYDELHSVYLRLSDTMSILTTFDVKNRVSSVGELSFVRLLLDASDKMKEEYLSDKFKRSRISDLDEDLKRTIKAFLDSGLSIAECARKLYLHRNTLIYRLDKIQTMTGLDIRSFDDAIVLMVAMIIEKCYY